MGMGTIRSPDPVILNSLVTMAHIPDIALNGGITQDTFIRNPESPMGFN